MFAPALPSASLNNEVPIASTEGDATKTTKKSKTSKHASRGCYECGEVRHKPDTACPFYRWATTFETVPRQRGEQPRDAKKRVWKDVRLRFVKDGKFFSELHWDYQGQPQ